MVNTDRVTGYLTRITLLFLFIFIFCPLLTYSSSAVNSGSCSGTVVNTTSAEFNVNPSSTNGAFGYGYMTITGCTSNSTGFTINMRSSTQDARLVYNKSGIAQFIDTIPNAAEVNMNVNEFPANGWGWGLSNVVDTQNGIDKDTGYGVYKPIPKSTDTAAIIGSTSSAGTSSTVIYFGARANTEILYGKYVNTIVITAIDNSVPTPGGEDDPGMSGDRDLGGSGTVATSTFISAPASKSAPAMSGTLDEENAPAQGATDETELSAATLAAVKHMEALIENLPSATSVTLAYTEMIESAMAAWNALNDLERSLVDKYLGMKYEAVVAAYQNLLANQPINGALVALGLAGAAVTTGVIVVAAAKKKRNERYYGDE